MAAYEHRVKDGRVVASAHVHHRNHNRTDNRPENLEYLTASEHRARHLKIIPSEIVPLYQSGLSTVAIARRTGFDASGIWRCLNRAGVLVQRHYRPAAELVNETECLRLHEAGWGLERLAARYGCSVGTIVSIRDRNGVAPHSVGAPRKTPKHKTEGRTK